MKVNLFKSIQNTADKYLLNKLEIQESVLIDEVENLKANSESNPGSDRIATMYETKKDELQFVQHNIKVIKTRLEN